MHKVFIVMLLVGIAWGAVEFAKGFGVRAEQKRAQLEYEQSRKEKQRRERRDKKEALADFAACMQRGDIPQACAGYLND